MYFCVDKKISHCMIVCLFVAFSSVATYLNINNENKVQRVQSYEWGLHFEKERQAPIPNLSDEKLNPYNAYYHGNLERKVLYITFDAGYENGHTEQILDALKKHNVSATFFVVGPYIKENPDLIKRMVAEGHTVGNHSYHHPNMTTKTKERFLRELDKTREEFKLVTGEDMPLFYRPPEGKFSTDNLQWAKDAGYTTVLWSSAYVDWNTDNQPSHDYAYEKIAQRTFDGAIFLFHSTSATNAEILDRQLTRWENEGYTFGDIRTLKENYS